MSGVCVYLKKTPRKRGVSKVELITLIITMLQHAPLGIQLHLEVRRSYRFPLFSSWPDTLHRVAHEIEARR